MTVTELRKKTEAENTKLTNQKNVEMNHPDTQR